MDLPELALRFILEHPAVSTTIPGMRRPAHVERNLAASDGVRLPPPARGMPSKTASLGPWTERHAVGVCYNGGFPDRAKEHAVKEAHSPEVPRRRGALRVRRDVEDPFDQA